MRYLIILFLLVGCGKDEQSTKDCSPECIWSGNYQERSPEFYVDYTPANPKRPMIGDVDRWWAWLKDCTGFNASITHAPLAIEYVNADTVNGGVAGTIWWTLGYTKITQNDVYDGVTTRHEMLHYLLYQVGQNDADNKNHTATYWSTCNVQQI